MYPLKALAHQACDTCNACLRWLTFKDQMFHVKFSFEGVNVETRDLWKCSSSSRSGGEHVQSFIPSRDVHQSPPEETRWSQAAMRGRRSVGQHWNVKTCILLYLIGFLPHLHFMQHININILASNDKIVVIRYLFVMFLEPDPITRFKNGTLSAELVGGKRKRRSEEQEMAAKVAKKQRSNSIEEIISSADPQRSKRGSRMRRAQRSKTEQESNDDTNPASESENYPVIILDEDTEKKGLNQFSNNLIILINPLQAQIFLIIQTTNYFCLLAGKFDKYRCVFASIIAIWQWLSTGIQILQFRFITGSVFILQMMWRRTCYGQTNITLSTPVTL